MQFDVKNVLLAVGTISVASQSTTMIDSQSPTGRATASPVHQVLTSIPKDSPTPSNPKHQVFAIPHTPAMMEKARRNIDSENFVHPSQPHTTLPDLKKKSVSRTNRSCSTSDLGDLAHQFVYQQVC